MRKARMVSTFVCKVRVLAQILLLTIENLKKNDISNKVVEVVVIGEKNIRKP